MDLIDTNVILRFFVQDKSEHHKRAVALFKKIDRGEIKVKIEHVVLFECVFVLQSYYELDREEIVELLFTLISARGIHVEKKRIIRRTLEFYKATKFHIVDCYLAAFIKSKPRMRIYSFDKDFDRLNLKRIEP